MYATCKYWHQIYTWIIYQIAKYSIFIDLLDFNISEDEKIPQSIDLETFYITCFLLNYDIESKIRLDINDAQNLDNVT